MSNDITVDFVNKQYQTMSGYLSGISHGGLTFEPSDNLVIGPIDVPCSASFPGGSYDSRSCSQDTPYGWQYFADQAARQVRLSALVLLLTCWGRACSHNSSTTGNG
jgi:hypothetical protein